MLSRQSQHAPLRRPHTLNPQPRPDLAMAFTMEAAGRQHAPDFHQQCIIRQATNRSRPARRLMPWRQPSAL